MIKTIFLSCFLAVSAAAQCPFILTEIQADPTPSRGLPEIEYLEFFLDSPTPLSLNGWSLQVNSIQTPFPNQVIPPYSYFVVIAESQRSKVTWEALTVGISRLTLSNTGAEVSVRSAQTSCSSTRYQPSWGEKYASGGYSLELQNKEGACLAETMWASTQSPTGGTPGLPPIQGFRALPYPSVQRIVPDSVSWDIHFSQPMYPKSGSWQEKSLAGVWVNSRTYRVQQALVKDQWNEGILSDFEDCTGQQLPDTTLRFGLFSPPKPGEWIWNEVLVDPLAGSSGFIELKSLAKVPRLWKGGQLVYQSLSSTRVQTLDLPQAGKVLSSGEVWAFTSRKPNWEGRYQVGLSVDSLDHWLDFANEGGEIQIRTLEGVVVDRIRYSSDWNHPLVKAEEGRSWQKGNQSWAPTPTLWGLATPGWEPVFENKTSQWFFDPPYLSKQSRTAILHFILPDDQFTLQARIYDAFGQVWFQYPMSHTFPKEGEWTWEIPELPGKRKHFFVLFEGFHPDGRLFREWVPYIWEID